MYNVETGSDGVTTGNEMLPHGGGVISAAPFERCLDQNRSEKLDHCEKKLELSRFLKLTLQIMPVP